MVYYSSTYYIPKFDTTARSYVYYLKIIYIKLSFLLVLSMSVFLLTGYNKNTVINEKINNIVNVSSKPCVYAMNFVDNGVTKVFNFFENIVFLYKENSFLREQNRKLIERETALYNTEYENANLRKLVNFIGANSVNNYITVRYNVITRNKFENKIKLNVGKVDNIKDGDIAIDNNGNFIGRTVRTADNSTEVMLLTDINSKIEAITLKNKVKLILNGNNSLYLNIAYINDNEYKLIEGDSVFFVNNHYQTKDFYIGKIVRVQDEFKVKIGKNFNYIDYITIIN